MRDEVRWRVNRAGRARGERKHTDGHRQDTDLHGLCAGTEVMGKRKDEMGKIKILSVRQPWAWLICAGYKDVENRSWKTNYRGRLYIHAGKSFDWNAMDWIEHHIPYTYTRKVLNYFGISQKNRRIIIHKECFGAIVGYVDLVDCGHSSYSIWEMPSFYHWQLQNPHQLSPIPMKGQLGIFEADETIVEGL